MNFPIAMAESEKEAEIARYVLGADGIGAVKKEILHDNYITRGEMTQIIRFIKGLTINDAVYKTIETETGFEDVPSSHPYARDILIAVGAG